MMIYNFTYFLINQFKQCSAQGFTMMLRKRWKLPHLRGEPKWCWKGQIPFLDPFWGTYQIEWWNLGTTQPYIFIPILPIQSADLCPGAQRQWLQRWRRGETLPRSESTLLVILYMHVMLLISTLEGKLHVYPTDLGAPISHLAMHDNLTCQEPEKILWESRAERQQRTQGQEGQEGKGSW